MGVQQRDVGTGTGGVEGLGVFEFGGKAPVSPSLLSSRSEHDFRSLWLYGPAAARKDIGDLSAVERTFANRSRCSIGTFARDASTPACLGGGRYFRGLSRRVIAGISDG